jgi:hypothetical protein
MRTKTLVILSLSLSLLGAVSARAQQATMVRARIPFSFTAAGKVLPAGQYEFIPAENFTTVRVVGTDKGSASVVQSVLTRLAGEMHTTPQDAHVVFDTIGGANTLSELWIPGQDGYVLSTTASAHKHAVVNAPMK